MGRRHPGGGGRQLSCRAAVPVVVGRRPGAHRHHDIFVTGRRHHQRVAASAARERALRAADHRDVLARELRHRLVEGEGHREHGGAVDGLRHAGDGEARRSGVCRRRVGDREVRQVVDAARPAAETRAGVGIEHAEADLHRLTALRRAVGGGRQGQGDLGGGCPRGWAGEGHRWGGGGVEVVARHAGGEVGGAGRAVVGAPRRRAGEGQRHRQSLARHQAPAQRHREGLRAALRDVPGSAREHHRRRVVVGNGDRHLGGVALLIAPGQRAEFDLHRLGRLVAIVVGDREAGRAAAGVVGDADGHGQRVVAGLGRGARRPHLDGDAERAAGGVRLAARRSDRQRAAFGDGVGGDR